jgi:ubiquitin-conjugating enzyme E2 Z
MSIFISKESVSRLLKDVKHIIKNPLIDNGIYYIHDDTNILKGYALIIGPEDTPYFGGNYLFELSYPADYPHSPPIIKYCTNSNNVRFNPNLYICGKVCVSLLNTWSGDQWTSCQTISTVLLTLCTLFCKDPLLNEPGITNTHIDLPKYNEIIQYSNLTIAVCDIIEKNPTIYLPFFEMFYPHIRENFFKNYDKLLEFAINKDTEYAHKSILTKTICYGMKINISYVNTIKRLNTAKVFCELNNIKEN